MKGKNDVKFDSEFQEIVNRSVLVLEQVRKEYAEAGLPMVTFDDNLCEPNEVLLVYPDGSRKIKNCTTNELRILP
jgi:hypothetical protein